MREGRFTGFAGVRRVASGTLVHVALELKALADAGAAEPLLLIDDARGEAVHLSLHGTEEDLRARIEAQRSASEEEAPASRGRGRPKLGVVSREVTLLPRHWAWLAEQPGGASATLRKLVEGASRENAPHDRARRARDAAYRFMYVMAGDLPGFEAACRALFAGDFHTIENAMGGWPPDIRAHALDFVRHARELAHEAQPGDDRGQSLRTPSVMKRRPMGMIHEIEG